MYITYYCDKFEFTVLCRFHIENFTKKAEKYSGCQILAIPVYFGF